MLETVLRLQAQAQRDFERDFNYKVYAAQERFMQDALFHARVTGLAHILQARAYADNLNWTLVALEAVVALEYLDENLPSPKVTNG